MRVRASHQNPDTDHCLQRWSQWHAKLRVFSVQNSPSYLQERHRQVQRAGGRRSSLSATQSTTANYTKRSCGKLMLMANGSTEHEPMPVPSTQCPQFTHQGSSAVFKLAPEKLQGVSCPQDPTWILSTEKQRAGCAEPGTTATPPSRAPSQPTVLLSSCSGSLWPECL